jgi:UDP-N-acetylglucosamine acyltransferase
MSSNIHATAIVSSGAELGDNVTIGPYSIIEDDVKIGSGCKIGSSVVLASGARLAKNVTVAHGAIIATVPQDLKFKGEPTTAEIGEGTTIREYATVNRGTDWRRRTTVGKNCLIMTYAHVAHDCAVGDNVIMANSVNLAGHIVVEDFAIIGGVVPVLQFVKIGCHSMIGGGYRVPQDVPPYSLVAGYPLQVRGLNAVGLKRRGFKPEVLKALREAYKLMFFSSLNTSQAIERIRAEVQLVPEVEHLIDFTKETKHGMIK